MEKEDEGGVVVAAVGGGATVFSLLEDDEVLVLVVVVDEGLFSRRACRWAWALPIPRSWGPCSSCREKEEEEAAVELECEPVSVGIVDLLRSSLAALPTLAMTISSALPSPVEAVCRGSADDVVVVATAVIESVPSGGPDPLASVDDEDEDEVLDVVIEEDDDVPRGVEPEDDAAVLGKPEARLVVLRRGSPEVRETEGAISRR